MKTSNPYGIVGSIYTNYIIQSITLIVIMQFKTPIAAQLGTDLTGIGYVASGIGIGKILIMIIGGILSDKYGRKPFILLGMCCYAAFFIGMAFCTNIHVAFLLAILAGVGNSFLDTGSMPALTECFPQAAGTVSVLVKSFISLGSFVLPFIAIFTIHNSIWFGWIFIGFSGLLLINSLFLFPKTFPSKDVKIVSASGDKDGNYFIGKPCMFIEGVCLILMGFTTTTTFIVIVQWMPTIAMQTVGMGADEASTLISYYSVGSLISVFFTAFIVKKLLKPVYGILIFPLLSLGVLMLFFVNISPLMCKVVAFGMGFAAAGGVLQLVLVVMSQLFPKSKGLAVGLVYTNVGVAVSLTPVVVTHLAINDASNAIIYNMVIATASLFLAAIINYRYRKVIDFNKV